MAVSKSFLEYVVEQMSASRREITQKRMFGALGFYADERFVAIVDNDRLFLKVDDASRADYEREGCVAFDPYGDGTKSMSYYEAPVRVLEDRDELAEWLERSWIAAGNKKPAKRRSRTTVG